MSTGRNWTVLLIGGPSGVGKSSIAYALAHHYGINVWEIDDLVEALKALTGPQALPAVHRWSTGPDWKEVGIAGNVDWLMQVSREVEAGLGAVVQNHLEAGVPVIIEGDFLSPEFTATFVGPAVRSLFIVEQDKAQIIENYMAREGPEKQTYRADISAAYGQRIQQACERLGVPYLAARPWDTAVQRAIACLFSSDQ